MHEDSTQVVHQEKRRRLWRGTSGVSRRKDAKSACIHTTTPHTHCTANAVDSRKCESVLKGNTSIVLSPAIVEPFEMQREKQGARRNETVLTRGHFAAAAFTITIAFHNLQPRIQRNTNTPQCNPRNLGKSSLLVPGGPECTRPHLRNPSGSN